MSYDYAEMREQVFTEGGQNILLAMYDRAQKLAGDAGAVRSDKLMRGIGGDSWLMLACIDRLVEIGKLNELTDPAMVPGQSRVFML